MRIVIATGVYPPEVGGPSYYAKGLEDAFVRAGHRVTVVPYGSLKSLPMGLSHLGYLCRLLIPVLRSDVVIALDTASVGVPAALVCSLTGKRLIIRTGGDFLWEQYLERTHDLLPLPVFYDKHRSFTEKEKLIYGATKFALSRAMVIFSTAMQQRLWTNVYAISAPTHVIANAIDSTLPAEPPTTKNFLWHVRPIAMKNGMRVHAAFAKAQRQNPSIVLEEGTMPKEQLLEKMKKCYAVILPSITEISPNYILDALRFKKPFIIDKYSGYAEWLAPYGLLVDPLDEADIARAIERLADPAGYQEALDKVSRFSSMRSYDQVAQDFLNLL